MSTLSKTILLLTEGLGISGSQAGNAFSSSNPTNFLNFWQNYSHAVINNNKDRSPSADLYQDPFSDYSALSCGKIFPHNQQFITNSVSDGSFFVNPAIAGLFEKIIQKNSALHLIGNLGNKYSRYGNILHLLALIEWAKHRKIFRVYIHLIVDDESYSDSQEALTDIGSLQAKLDSIGVGEIATISGQNYFETAKLKQSFEGIVNGKAKSALSAEQAFAMFGRKVSSISDFPPSVVSFRGKPIGKFNHFDGVILFNHDSSKLEKFVRFLCSSRNSATRFIDSVSFFDDFVFKPDSLRIAFKRNYGCTIPERVADSGGNSLMLFQEPEKSKIDHFCNFSNAKTISYKAIAEKEIDRYLACLLDQINQDEDNDLIVGLVPLISDGSFSDTVKTVKLFDDFIPFFAKATLAKGANLVLASPCGRIESLGQSVKYSKINSKSDNPLPFLVVSPLCKRSGTNLGAVGNQLFYDMLKANHNFVDIAPTIIRLIGANLSDITDGENFLDELISKGIYGK